MLRLDDRYLLLADRDVRWLDRAFDGWDLVSNAPVTIGYFASSDPPPVLPATLRLVHPNILRMLDLRLGTDGGVWVVWEHFGLAGADILHDMPAPSSAVSRIAHEATRCLLFAREAGDRPGGFRMADFGADQIRLFADGSVRLVGFGRLAVEHADSVEFGRLGEWTASWLAHSSDSGAEADLGAALPGEALAALSAFGEADSNPHAGAARILSGLSLIGEGGKEELGRWIASRSLDDAGARLGAQARSTVDDPELELDVIGTIDLAGSSDIESGGAHPAVTIAPAERPTVKPRAAGLYKGLPHARRNLFPFVVLVLLLAVMLLGGWRFRWFTGLFGIGVEAQIKIESAPAGAAVMIDGDQLAGTTPLALNDLATGWHRIELSAPQFPPLQDSFLVYKEGPHRPFLFVFIRPIRIESRPSGAVVYQNGKRAPRVTPFVENDWPVSEPLSLVMHLESFGSIEDCLLDPAYGTVEVKDPAAWSTDRRGDTVVVEGVFMRTVSFLASPPDCRLQVDDTLQVDPTGAEQYALTFGAHEVRAQAIGFDPLDTTLVISGQSPAQLGIVLARPVRISAYDPRWPDSDLRALVDRLDGPDRTLYVRRFTPYSVRIPAVAFTAVLRKRGYRDTTLYIPPDLTRLHVAMSPGADSPTAPPEASAPDLALSTQNDAQDVPESAGEGPWVTIEISVPSRRPLEGAQIWSRAAGETQETFLGRTDAKGQLRVRMPVGNYDLLAYLDAFSGVHKRARIRAARNRPIVVELSR